MMIQSSLLPDETLDVKRDLNNGLYSEDGYPKAQRIKKFQVTGNVQPISGFEILQVEEADRKRQILNLFTATQLEPDDVVVRNGVDFEVRTVEDWTQQNLPHFVCRLVRKDTR